MLPATPHRVDGCRFLFGKPFLGLILLAGGSCNRPRASRTIEAQANFFPVSQASQDVGLQDVAQVP
jgi:hypothetical protein